MYIKDWYEEFSDERNRIENAAEVIGNILNTLPDDVTYIDPKGKSRSVREELHNIIKILDY